MTNERILNEINDETPQGHHKRKYQRAVESYGRSALESLVLTVWTPEELVEGYYKDENLNSDAGKAFEIGAWDALAKGYVSGQRIKADCPEINTSLASRVCLLKACARGIVFKQMQLERQKAGLE